MSRGRGKTCGSQCGARWPYYPEYGGGRLGLHFLIRFMNTEMNVADVGGDRRVEKQARVVFNQLPDRTIPLSTSAAQG